MSGILPILMSLLNWRVNNYGCHNCLHTCAEGALLLGAAIPPASNWAHHHGTVMSDDIWRQSCVFLPCCTCAWFINCNAGRHRGSFNGPKCQDLGIEVEFECLNNIEFIQFLTSLLESRSLARAIFSLVFFVWTSKCVCALQWNIHHVQLGGLEIYVTVKGHSNSHRNLIFCHRCVLLLLIQMIQ
jgi:hypothetical protein